MTGLQLVGVGVIGLVSMASTLVGPGVAQHPDLTALVNGMQTISVGGAVTLAFIVSGFLHREREERREVRRRLARLEKQAGIDASDDLDAKR